VDESTGELLFFNYGIDFKQSAPVAFFHFGEVNRSGHLTNYQQIPLPLTDPHQLLGMPHDMAFSKNYCVLNYFAKDKARFAVIPRHGSASQVQWFEGSRTYVLHFVNAYEDGEEIVMEGYHMNNPDAFTKLDCLNLHAAEPKLWRWRFDLRSGETSESIIDERNLEFGLINQRYQGLDHKYVYSVLPHNGEFMFTGLTKTNVKTGETSSFSFGTDVYGSEAPVAPKVGGTDEDDAYLVSFISDVAQNRSTAVIVDAKNIAGGPVCTILLPHRISSGTHAFWADDAATAVVTAPPPLAKL
jgi:carotenoid cleavage dioxygenase